MKKLHLCSFFTLFSIFSLSSQARLDAMVPYNRALCLERAWRVVEAEADYKKAIEICLQELTLNQTNIQKLNSYAVCTWSLSRLKRYDDVVKYCKEALKIAPDNRIIETIGEAYFYLGKYSLALRNLEQYVDSYQGYRLGDAYFLIGEIYELQKKYNKADVAYSMALKQSPRNVLWWFKLAKARENALDKESQVGKRAALETYRQVARLSPSYPGVQEKIRELQRL